MTARIHILMFGVVLCALLAPTAQATIVQPSVGSSVSTTGRITLRMSLVNTVCSTAISGVVLTTSTTSFALTSRGCTIGSLTMPYNLPMTIALDGTWVMHVRVGINLPIWGQCVYEGRMGGTWHFVIADTALTITSGALPVSRLSAPICASGLIITGTFIAEDLVVV